MPPTFRYSIGDAARPVAPGSILWESPLPGDRHHFRNTDKGAGRHSGVTHGDYFSAARRFIEKDGFSALSAAMGPEVVRDITDIDICLMKHGECYHPARVTTAGNGHRRVFVLNVAVSDPGLGIMDVEVATLKRLHGLAGSAFVPEVYSGGGLPLDGGRPVRMFLGQWFEGYHEFHLSGVGPDGQRRIFRWGEGDRPVALSAEEACALYHEAARILTCCYDMATTAQISSWHHAAGDFVVRCEANRVSVRLITVRRYGPLLRMKAAVGDPDHCREQVLSALLLFFLNLSIRMRLDRLDGIGEPAWADDTALIGIWTGFLAGLSATCFPVPWLPDPVSEFQRYLAACSADDLLEIAESLAAAMPLGMDEKTLVQSRIGPHAEALCDTIGRIGFP